MRNGGTAMAEQNLQRRQNGLSVASGTSLTASQQTLAVQMHLTALNAKSEPESELVAEFDRIFGKESPDAMEWAFRVWRERSPFFPAVSEIRKLVIEFHRGQREQAELKAKLDEKFLLEERRRQGQVPDFQDVAKQLREAVEKKGEPEHLKRVLQFRQKMQGVGQIVQTLHLTEEQIAARREKERAECEKYRTHADANE
jgi:hypothetical protein